MPLPQWIRHSLILAAAASFIGSGPAQAATAPLAPILSIGDVAMVEGHAGTSLFNFTVSLSQAAGTGGVSFSIATADNTATTAGLDYQSMAADLIIAEGQSQVVFGVTVFGDVLIEPNEVFFVNISGLTGALAGDSQGQGTILNDDALTPPPAVPEPATAWLVAGALAAAGWARRQRR